MLQTAGNCAHSKLGSMHSTAQVQHCIRRIMRGKITRQKVGMAPVLITSLCTSSHRVKTGVSIHWTGLLDWHIFGFHTYFG